MPTHPAELNQVRGGDLLFFSGRRMFSRIIQIRTGSEWSHVGVAVRLFGDLFVMESLEGVGVRLVPISVWLNWRGRIGIGRTNLDLDQRSEMVRLGLQQLGRPYASPRQFLRSFSIVWAWLARRFRLAADVDSDGQFCSEFAAALIREVGGHVAAEPATISPGRVPELCPVIILEVYP